MTSKALGLIETVGLAAAIEAADAAVKSANVALLGYEKTRGNGMITVKFVGDVGAVKAAVAAGSAAALQVGQVQSCLVIPRPHAEIETLIKQLDRGPALEPVKTAKPKRTAAPKAKQQPAKAVEAEKASPAKTEAVKPAEKPKPKRRRSRAKSAKPAPAAPPPKPDESSVAAPAKPETPKPVPPPAPAEPKPAAPDKPEEPKLDSEKS
jgi:microcompartment protein CcmL/EutN